jgi:putative DNA primase/helicase
MDYIQHFKDLHIFEGNEQYPCTDIGTAKLFYDLHRDIIRCVDESDKWYVYDGRRWAKDERGFKVMEMCKAFAGAYHKYAEMVFDGSEESKAFMKYGTGLTGRKRRESLLCDAKSVAPVSLSVFDRNKYLLNLQNGTYDLAKMEFRSYCPNDYITKRLNAKYNESAVCERWEKFIHEIMCGDYEVMKFLQKVMGYALSGDTSLECFFILHGSTTRNGKSTLTETIGHIMGDYARTIQPETLSRRSTDGSKPSPDIARLKGARLVNMPEPEKGLELNIALVKQLTGGDTYTGRFLNENPIEYKPEFKILINTNHLPRTSDDTVFSSDRVKIIPFDRHFSPEEQDNSLKKLFRKNDSKSGILNWMIEGYRLLQSEGLTVPDKIKSATLAYRQEVDIIGSFLTDCTARQDGNRLPTSELYAAYASWAKDNGYRQMNNKNFVSDLRKRLDIRRDGNTGNVIVGLVIDTSPNPFIA